MAERIAMRTCSKCGQSKPETTEFFRRRGTKDRGGLRPDCRDCSKARDRAYYEANPEWFSAYRKANADRIRQYMRTYEPHYYQTENGRRRRVAANRRWLDTEAGRLAAALAAQRRRARVANLDSTFTAEDWTFCLAMFERRCAYCGTDGPLAQEHVVPVERGGPYTAANIVPACISCNSSKSVRPLGDWFPAQSFYSEERMMRIDSYLKAVA